MTVGSVVGSCACCCCQTRHAGWPRSVVGFSPFRISYFSASESDTNKLSREKRQDYRGHRMTCCLPRQEKAAHSIYDIHMQRDGRFHAPALFVKGQERQWPGSVDPLRMSERWSRADASFSRAVACIPRSFDLSTRALSSCNIHQDERAFYVKQPSHSK